MSAQKIRDNLWLGSMRSVPEDTDYVMSLASEIYENDIDFHKYPVYFEDNEHFWFRAFDFPEKNDINLSVVKLVLKRIDEHLKKNDKVYVHCIYGVNRSASHVFMYLIATNQVLKNRDNLQKAILEFQALYPRFSPNPGWLDFLRTWFPFNNWV
ncbi:dual specificity protein phosphatase [Spiroplasma endosymbiont of Labia minor]|uniref:dual specificity protein phosphatase family protein n=1 Tax=Spiroplasma endosymbiont of Labia minor TaxID=3066305 RepID=UPI0030D20038